MRYCVVTAFVVLALAKSASAQEIDIDGVLTDWKKTVSGTKTFACVIERKSLDKALGVQDDFRGQVFFQKALKNGDGNQVLFELKKTTNPAVYEKYIFTGSELHEYVAAIKTVRVHQLPDAQQASLPQADLIGFLFGLGAEQVKKRYDLELKQPSKPDPYYHYVQITPKMAQDKSEFTQVRLALFRKNNLPAQIWFLQPNRNEVTWNFTEIRLNAEFPANQFVPDVPPGWRVVRVALPPMLPAKKQ